MKTMNWIWGAAMVGVLLPGLAAAHNCCATRRTEATAARDGEPAAACPHAAAAHQAAPGAEAPESEQARAAHAHRHADAPAAAHGDEADGATKAQPQTRCPIMAERSINRRLHVDHEGQRIYVCCRGCIARVRANPAAALAALQAQGVTPERVEPAHHAPHGGEAPGAHPPATPARPHPAHTPAQRHHH